MSDSLRQVDFAVQKVDLILQVSGVFFLGGEINLIQHTYENFARENYFQANTSWLLWASWKIEFLCVLISL